MIRTGVTRSAGILSRLLLFLLLFLLLLPTAALAQAAITGLVKDASGGVLPGVTVEVASPVLIEKVRSVTTDATGQYRVVDLRPGNRRLGPRRVKDRTGQVDLVAAARRAREHADAAFSHFKVGAALESGDGSVTTGCNIENATYGLTICAERVAMFKAISEGHRVFTRIAIVADTEAPTPPCGACRQILWEFAGNLEVILANLTADTGSHYLKDLLPHPFDARLL